MYPSNNNYLKAVWWLGLSIMTSCFNDVLTKYLATGLPACQICFFRFYLGSIVLVPIIYFNYAPQAKCCLPYFIKCFFCAAIVIGLYYGLIYMKMIHTVPHSKLASILIYFGGILGFLLMCYYSHAFKTKYYTLHFVRGLLVAIAMGLYCYSLTYVQMSTVTVIGFMNPIFVLILAHIFLKESVLWPVWMATLLSFIGIAVVFRPVIATHYIAVLACISATIIFAILDIINKQYVTREPILFLLFFSSAMAALCISPVAYYDGQIPTPTQLGVLSILGIGSNLILYFLLKAFALANIAALAAIKYTELLVSILFGMLFFNEWPTATTHIGAALIITCTWFVVYYHHRSS